ncbi:hypothetical protein PROFUN_11907 [Planoprotostelium fungivorum]|uniref:Uncharacterized protein n=1 Tax=Planoprotostelium fungivorum TaxID=1890364 RepID=A0A2P6N934_9EUKA|nr:hypothetical protein PROFUN_11907 [Planoprotostelium fungivorum]
MQIAQKRMDGMQAAISESKCPVHQKETSDKHSPMNKKQLAALCKDRNIKVGNLDIFLRDTKKVKGGDLPSVNAPDDEICKMVDTFNAKLGSLKFQHQCWNWDSAIFCYVIKMLAVQAWTLWLKATFNGNINPLERTIEHFIIQLRTKLLEESEQ